MLLKKLLTFVSVLSVHGQSSVDPQDLVGPSFNETLLESFDFLNCGSIANNQADYRGGISVTESGIPCQNWSEQIPHSHNFNNDAYPDTGLGDHHSCRNPDMSPAPWCFTVSEEIRWERCHIPACEKTWKWEKMREAKEKLEKEANDAKAEFDNFFDDVRDLNNLCKRFLQDYNADTCEKDLLGGSKRDNSNGFEDEEYTLSNLGNEHSSKINEKENHETTNEGEIMDSDDEKQVGWLTSKKTIRGALVANQDVKAERMSSELTHEINRKNMCLINPIYLASTAGALFHKIIRVLVADPNYKQEDYQKSLDAIKHFNDCAENMIIFSMETHVLEEVNVSGKNWMEATYEVLEAAHRKGVKVHAEKRYIANSQKIFTSFNMKESMTMVILPDGVDFEGAYGFAILHNGLSIIRAEQAKYPSTILHELGHGLGMRHSSSPDGGIYGDDRCIMGDARDDTVCFNGPKSVYLGLYRSYTGIVYPLQDQCEAELTIADVKEHLFRRTNIFDMWGRYYVIVQVPYQDSKTSLHLMYYGDDNNQFLSATEGSIETIIDTRIHRVSTASTSQRVFDLMIGKTKTHRGILYKLCETVDKKIARVMISHNVNAILTCPSKTPVKTTKKYYESENN